IATSAVLYRPTRGVPASTCSQVHIWVHRVAVLQGRVETLKKFHSHVLPSSEEKACPQTGRSLFRASQRNITMIGFPLSVSLPKKWPTPFSNDPTTGGSIVPVLLAIQYRLHNRVFRLKSRRVIPSNSLPSCPGNSVVE